MKRSKFRKIGFSCMIIFVLAVFMVVGVSAGSVQDDSPVVVEDSEPSFDRDVSGYQILFHLNGGSLPDGWENPTTGLTVCPMLPTPSWNVQTGYTAFQGWYTDASFTTPFDYSLVGTEMTGNIEVWAKWSTATAGNVSGLLVIFRNIVSSVFTWMISAVDFVVDNPIILVPMLMFFVCGGVIAIVKRLMRG